MYVKNSFYVQERTDDNCQLVQTKTKNGKREEHSHYEMGLKGKILRIIACVVVCIYIAYRCLFGAAYSQYSSK